jgi:uracil-DNA glycosylase
MSKVNLKEIQEKLYLRLKDSGWGDKMKMFILSQEFYSILEHLAMESKDGRRFTPVLKQLFRAFEECPYNELKVVIVGQDPYPQAGVADGISFSCSNDGKVQKSLNYIFKEIENTVYPDGYTWDPDLKRWSNQGVLMLNTALTCEVGNIGAHVKLWKPFTLNLLDYLATYNTGLLYVFMGNKAKEFAKLIPQNNYKFFTMHPASAAYRGGKWDSGDLFNSVNKVLKENYNTQIKW